VRGEATIVQGMLVRWYLYTDGRAVTLPIFIIDLPIYILDDLWPHVGMLRNESMKTFEDGECFRGTYHMEFIERCDLLVQTSWDYNF